MDFLRNFPDNLRNIAEKACLETPNQIIVVSNLTLARHGAKVEEISLLKNLAAKCICSDFMNVNDLVNHHSFKWSKISFGCRALDKCTGGILTRGITEICGESGVGKTQVALQLSIMIQMPEKYGGLGKSAVYISTEDAFPSKRLFQMAQHFNETYPDINKNFLQNIFVVEAYDSETLQSCISNRLPTFMETHHVGLVIIDSIAAIYRIETNIIGRANEMRKLVNKLLKLCDKYTCAVICINQVASAMDESNTQVPCLGLSWANLIRTRLKITKEENNAFCSKAERFDRIRKISVLFSPEVPNNSCEFLITSEGIVDLPV